MSFVRNWRPHGLTPREAWLVITICTIHLVEDLVVLSIWIRALGADVVIELGLELQRLLSIVLVVGLFSSTLIRGRASRATFTVAALALVVFGVVDSARWLASAVSSGYGFGHVPPRLMPGAVIAVSLLRRRAREAEGAIS